MRSVTINSSLAVARGMVPIEELTPADRTVQGSDTDGFISMVVYGIEMLGPEYWCEMDFGWTDLVDGVLTTIRTGSAEVFLVYQAAYLELTYLRRTHQMRLRIRVRDTFLQPRTALPLWDFAAEVAAAAQAYFSEREGWMGAWYQPGLERAVLLQRWVDGDESALHTLGDGSN